MTERVANLLLLFFFQLSDWDQYRRLSSKLFPGNSGFLLSCLKAAHSRGLNYVFVNTFPRSLLPRRFMCYTRLFREAVDGKAEDDEPCFFDLHNPPPQEEEESGGWTFCSSGEHHGKVENQPRGREGDANVSESAGQDKEAKDGAPPAESRVKKRVRNGGESGSLAGAAAGPKSLRKPRRQKHHRTNEVKPPL